jgi:hypothetical protein
MLMMKDFIVHGVNNKCVDELLLLLHKYILPLDNCLPINMFHVKFLTLKGRTKLQSNSCMHKWVCIVLRGVCKSHDMPKVKAITTQESRHVKHTI